MVEAVAALQAKMKELRDADSAKIHWGHAGSAAALHKAQGQTLDDVCIDFDSGAFAPGQSYVTLFPGALARAARDAADRQAALAEMTEIAEQYVRLRSAVVLLQWAIDRYRREKQAPMLKRAGELFAILTCGSFQTLQLEFDEHDNMQLAGLHRLHTERACITETRSVAIEVELQRAQPGVLPVWRATAGCRDVIRAASGQACDAILRLHQGQGTARRRDVLDLELKEAEAALARLPAVPTADLMARFIC